MEKGREDAYTSPSFSTYSSAKLAELVVKIGSEKTGGDDKEEDEEADFEFSLVRQDTELSADEFLYNADLGTIFPVFNRDILLSDSELGRGAAGGDASDIQVPLSKLSIGDRSGDDPPSCSSSEVDDTENIPTGSYCVWRPKVPDFPSPMRCKKSKSTGSASKRWKFRDLLLRRSNSDGKESLVFLTPRNREEKPPATETPKKLKGKEGSGSGAGSSSAAAARSAHEALYVRNRNMNEVHKKKSFLPYRKDLVGFFVNANAMGKGFPHM